MPSVPSDRNLVFGLLALRSNFVTKDQLIAAMQDWFVDRSTPLAQFLCNRGSLDGGARDLLDRLVDCQLTLHDGDTEASIAALSSGLEGLEFFGIGPAGTMDSFIKSKPFSSERADSLKHSGSVSRFRHLRSHREGGLGEVFVAEDTELQREVALKEIKRKYANDQNSRDRFIMEAEVTGGLEHPGVVPVYGMGCYEDGRPFYAMRFIKGDTLKEAISDYHKNKSADSSQRAIAFRQLLARFINVCHALAYAHSRGVVHRDVKPSNVMLGKFGETLLVDWGLAKTVGRNKSVGPDATYAADPTLRPGSGSAVVTMAGQVLGTPAYMSPEQAAGNDENLSPQSDIFSLGATLYTILVGKPPFDGAVEDVLHNVQNCNFAKPRQMNHEAPPGLEAICLKAMAQKPENRYLTAEALAADIEHWLADESVTAWREPFGTRAWRWVRRHRTAVTAAAVLLAATAIALGVSTALIAAEQKRTDTARQLAQDESNRAEENLALARETTLNLLNIAETRLPSDQNTLATRLQIIETALSTFRKFLAQQPTHPEIRSMTARCCRYAGNAHRLLVDRIEQGREEFVQAVDLLNGLNAEMPAKTGYRDQLAETLRDYGRLLHVAGQYPDALAAFRRSMGLADALRKEAPDSLDYCRTLAYAAHHRCVTEYTIGSYPEAAQLGQQAAALFAIIVDGPTPRLIDRIYAGMARNWLAMSLREKGDQAEAIKQHCLALCLLEALPDSDDRTNQVAIARYQHAKTLSKTPAGYEDAILLLTQAIGAGDRLQKQFAGNITYPEALASYLNARATIYAHQDQVELAIADLSKSRSLLEPIDNKRRFQVLGPLGRTYLLLGDLDPANRQEWHGKAKKCLTTVTNRAPGHKDNQIALDEVNGKLRKASE